MSMKSSNDTTGNRTRYLPTCSAVPQTTAPLRAPVKHIMITIIKGPCHLSNLVTGLSSRRPRFDHMSVPMLDLWLTKLHWNKFLSVYFAFPGHHLSINTQSSFTFLYSSFVFSLTSFSLPTVGLEGNQD